MTLIFDTSAAIEWLKGNEKVKFDTTIALSVISSYELLWSTFRRGKRIHDLTMGFVRQCQILNIDFEISVEAARLKAQLIQEGKEKPMADIMIASTASKLKIPLITFDSDFEVMSQFIELDLTVLDFK